MEKIDKKPLDSNEKKNFPPAVLEWPNSTYGYNKNAVRLSAVKDKTVNNIIKSYFNLAPVSKKNTKSKRMRTLIRRSSTKKLFVSKAEIKQTNDKIIVTIYTVNRIKDFYIKKIYLINKSLTNLKKYKSLNITKFNNNLVNISKIYPRDLLVTARARNNKTNLNSFSPVLLNKIKQSFAFKKYLNKPFKYTRYTNKTLAGSRLHKSRDLSNYHWRIAKKEERKIFRKKTSYFYLKKLIKTLPFSFNEKKIKNFRSIFFFYFITWALALFDIEIYLEKDMLIVGKSKEINEIKGEKFADKDKNINIIIGKYLKENNIKVFYIKRVYFFKKLKNVDIVKRVYSLNALKKINIILLGIFSPISSSFLSSKERKEKEGSVTLIPCNSRTILNQEEKQIVSLFKEFNNKYLALVMNNIFVKEALSIQYLHILSINSFKFTKLLPNLKIFINKIYNKKLQVNLVNLKYLYLNSDIFMDAVAIKLRNKKNNLLRVIKRALRLVKIPTKFIKVRSAKHENKSVSENINRLNLKDLNDSDYIILKEMFSHNTNRILSNYSSWNLGLRLGIKKLLEIKAKRENSLNSLKYKWVTGVWLEGKGRLTRRFTASRSLFKYKYKGNLKNMNNSKEIDYSKDADFLKRTPSTVMLRGQIIPNVQYTYNKSKRRIGAFGVKGWISSS